MSCNHKTDIGEICCETRLLRQQLAEAKEKSADLQAKVNKLSTEYAEQLAGFWNGICGQCSSANKRAEEAEQALSAKSEALAKVGCWRGMDSAPKDGSEFVIRYPHQANVLSLCRWNSVYKCWQNKGSAIFPESQGCEWYPILASLPPEDKKPEVPA